MRASCRGCTCLERLVCLITAALVKNFVDVFNELRGDGTLMSPICLAVKYFLKRLLSPALRALFAFFVVLVVGLVHKLHLSLKILLRIRVTKASILNIVRRPSCRLVGPRFVGESPLWLQLLSSLLALLSPASPSSSSPSLIIVAVTHCVSHRRRPLASSLPPLIVVAISHCRRPLLSSSPSPSLIVFAVAVSHRRRRRRLSSSSPS
eukprot:6196008-Pleurochrysis_carterae.AAC.2